MTGPRITRRNVLRQSVVLCVLGSVALPSFSQTSENPVEGGIGGTGIVGLLTDFGSLYVNGRYIQTDADTEYSDGFGRLRKSDLRVSQSLTIEANASANGLLARRVHVTYPVVGRIDAVLRQGRALLINGVEVRLPQTLRGFDVGDRVAVSGLWRGQSVEASLLEQARSNSDLVSGDVSRSGLAITVGATKVQRTGALQNGSFATIIGRFDPARLILRAQNIEEGRFTGAAGRLRQLSIEGYLEPTERAPGYRVSGLGHSFKRNLQLSNFTSSRMLFSGPYTGTFAANEALVLPDSLQARRRILRRIRKD